MWSIIPHPLINHQCLCTQKLRYWTTLHPVSFVKKICDLAITSRCLSEDLHAVDAAIPPTASKSSCTSRLRDVAGRHIERRSFETDQSSDTVVLALLLESFPRNVPYEMRKITKITSTWVRESNVPVIQSCLLLWIALTCRLVQSGEVFLHVHAYCHRVKWHYHYH